MDDISGSRMQELLDAEGSRASVPDGFPKLPELPVARYHNAALYEQEIMSLFRRTWLFAGHVSDVPVPGSYRVLDIPFAPLVMTRASDGQIRVLVNACRHRGAPVVRADCGQAKKLVCQYHSWAYELDGRLARVSSERDFDSSVWHDRDLGQLRCEVVKGFVFVTFDDDAVPLEDFLAPLLRRLGDMASEDLRPVHHKTYELQCNWKIPVEAFLETYHLQTIHPETVASLLDPHHAVDQMYQHGHSASYLPFRHAGTGDSELGTTNWTSTLPTIPGVSDFYSRNYVTPLVFPNSIIAPDPAGYPIMSMWPIGVGRTRMEVRWYGVPWAGADEQRPSEWDARLSGFDVVTDEDLKNLEPVQRSLEAATHAGIPLSYKERRIWQFHVEIDRLINTTVLPPATLVPDLLSDYVEA